MQWVSIIFIFCLLSGQNKYPADTLLNSPDISIIHKTGIRLIAGWQRISYNTNLFNCQFHPSCSNYGAQAITKFGPILGSAIASDRIIRCNPFALYYQLKYQRTFHELDGRLNDPVTPSIITKSNKSPILAGVFSALIPGLGRIYAGRFIDGIMGMTTMYMMANTAYKAINNDKPLIASFYISLSAFIYFGEIYGGWRAAKFDVLPK
jgi:hypothetical protein